MVEGRRYQNEAEVFRPWRAGGQRQAAIPKRWRVVQPYTPEKTVSYENLVRLEYRRQCNDFKFPKDTPLDVRITAYYGIPKSASKKKAQLMRERKIRPMKKPDFDNIGKIVCDSLNDIAYHDDAQIVDAQVRKFFSDDPRVVVTIQEAE